MRRATSAAILFLAFCGACSSGDDSSGAVPRDRDGGTGGSSGSDGAMSGGGGASGGASGGADAAGSSSGGGDASVGGASGGGGSDAGVSDANAVEGGGAFGNEAALGSGDGAPTRDGSGESGTEAGIVYAPCSDAVPVTTGTPATVTVNLAAMPRTTVSPDLMGVHTAVYDGLLTTTPSTATLLAAAGVTSLRYPGGSYSDLYHWETNTGTATPAAGQGSNVIYVDPTANFGSFVSLLQQTGGNALITVNYGMNPAGTGPGVPEEAAAWVAYANGSPTSTTVIGVDADGTNWNTVGYWASLRAAAPLLVDDGKNFLRIGRAAPVGIKRWEVGNELYGNGFYQGSATFAGWEADFHAPYNGANGTLRRNNAALSSTTYGMGVRAFAAKMKAVDPTIQVGGVLNWPDSAYAGWNSGVLAQACASMDFAVAHWYPGSTMASLLTAARMELPTLHSALRAVLTANCPAGANAAMPIAITEWGPNINNPTNGIVAALDAMPPQQTQLAGLFAAESYAHMMEQGTISAHWAQLHAPSYLGQTASDSGWGYHGAVMAHYLASGGDTMLPEPTVTNAGALAPLLAAHAAVQADGTLRVMLTNTSPTIVAAVTVSVTGGATGTALGCSGLRHAYTPVSTDLDGAVTSQPIFSAASRSSFSVAVPAYSVVVVSFPKG